jgi:hypothetical protein
MVVYAMTAVAVATGVFLNVAFANGKFALGNLWGEHYYAENTIWTYLSLLFVAGIGIATAWTLPREGIVLRLSKGVTGPGEVEVDDVAVSKLVFGSRYIGGILPVSSPVSRGSPRANTRSPTAPGWTTATRWSTPIRRSRASGSG